MPRGAFNSPGCSAPLLPTLVREIVRQALFHLRDSRPERHDCIMFALSRHLTLIRQVCARQLLLHRLQVA